MRNLSDFEIPKEGEVTLCEVDGQTHSMSYEHANVNVFTNTVENYPKIHIARHMLHPIRATDEGKALFLSVDVPFLKHLVHIYYEHGYIEVLRIASVYNNYVFSKFAQIVLTILSGIDNMRAILNPSIKDCGTKMISGITETRNWLNCPIRCISWHPHCTKLAIGTCDDTVRIYYKYANLAPVLKCKQQKNITDIAWRPMSDSEIAVACENYIIIWNVDPHSVVSRPSTNCAIMLHRTEHRPIVSIAWSPRGDVLATAAACDSSILIWDVELDRTSSLKRPGSAGNNLLKWSPSGDKMFNASLSLIFRVWECQTWKAERWSVLSGRIQTACWSPCGSVLLFATNEEPVIYALSFIKSDLIFAADTNNSPNLAVPLFDVTKLDIDGVTVGGIVQCIKWDPTGNHLAVVFQDTNHIAVFSVTFHPMLQLNASCLIIGTSEEVPCAIEFQSNFEHGACLAIAWSSGRLQYFPIVYSDLAKSGSRSFNYSMYNS